MILPAATRAGRRVPVGLRRVVAALAAAAVLVGAGAPVTAQPANPPAEDQEQGHTTAPLAVTIESMSPATVPRRGTITLTGEIRNRSRSDWTNLHVYLFTSARPMTTGAEVAEATATDATLEVGARITSPGRYDEVPDLAPGETTRYRLSVPRRELPFSEPGVYWIGVHVLGTNEEGRLGGADGRARTFVALMPERRRRATVSLVLPLRAPVRRTQEGRLANPERWARRLDEEGRLGRLTGLGASGFGVPLTWLVDPAVLDAAGSLAQGNPAFDLAPSGPDQAEQGTGEPDTPLIESPGPEGGDVAQGTDPQSELAELSEEAEVAGSWLDDFVADAGEQDVLVLPYGDVDVASLLRRDFGDIVQHAHGLALETTSTLGLDADPVVAPMSGLLPEAALGSLDPGLSLLLSERAAPQAPASRVRLRQGTDALLTDDVARTGGPGPNQRFGALMLRQQILAEAAVHGLSYGPDRPLLVSLPEEWNPGPHWRSASFFSGLTTSWLRLVPLSTAAAMSEQPDYGEPLSYTRAERRAELPVDNVLATEELSHAGGLLAALLTRNDTIDDQVARAAMLGASVHVRAHPDRARARTGAISEQVHHRLSQVYVEAADLVTMSSETGNMAVTLVNDLPEPVTVGLEAHTGTDELRIHTPELVSLGPGQRATVRLAVRATDTGVHSVRLVPTTEDGRPLGRSTVIRVRSSQVGLVIWLIMGTGAVVFVAAIGSRIRRQVRERKRTPGPLLKEPDR